MKNDIKNYIYSARQVGHTSLIMDNLKDVDKPFYVLGGYMNNSRDIVNKMGNKNAIPVSVQSQMRGDKLPLVIDNHAYTLTCEMYEDEIQKLHHHYAKEKKYLKEKISELAESKKIYAKRNNYLNGLYHFEVRRNQNHLTAIKRYKETIKNIKESKIDFLNSLSLFERIFKKIKNPHFKR